MSGTTDRAGVASIGHNLSPEQRRADFEALITRYAIEARNVQAMSLDEIRLLSDKQRLVAYQHGHLISTIRACRANDRLDAYLAVRDIVFAMADLSQRICMLSARQMGAVLNRDERTIRRCLDRLVEDGIIVRIVHKGLFNSHYPALDRNISTATGSPDWIINAYVPGTLRARRYPGHVRPDLVADPEHTAPEYPGHVRQALRTCKADTPGVHARQNISKSIFNREEPRRSVAGPYPLETVKRSSLRRETKNHESDDVRKLIDAYNERASKHGWVLCETVADDRARRLLKRVREIGGRERFEMALDAVTQDDFLSGRVPCRNGGKPFKLTIDRLLSTTSGMGDVLARLLEEHVAQPVAQRAWSQCMKKLSEMTPDGWRVDIEKFANDIWPIDKLGPAPGDPNCRVPHELVRELKLDKTFDQNGLRRPNAPTRPWDMDKKL